MSEKFENKDHSPTTLINIDGWKPEAVEELKKIVAERSGLNAVFGEQTFGKNPRLYKVVKLQGNFFNILDEVASKTNDPNYFIREDTSKG